ncbi:hypothetical protein Taro_053226 [Colocasia esculenta]|uniref:Uncharacterized protein n=1 Tax=Colocasia esculenta TaxID=4460 RepID=A0A843XM71_COLES|nr:hypothetical protein [Colocasia esculenta]
MKMESGKNTGEGSSRRKRQVERRSSRCRVEDPLVEEEAPEVEMAEEEEVNVLALLECDIGHVAFSDFFAYDHEK